MTEAIFNDVRYAVRMLAKNPGFTVSALAALGIGIGANTAIFSVINSVLLKPLGYPDADRIVLFFLTTPAGPSYGGSATKFNVWRRQTRSFQDVSAYEYQGADLNLTGGPYPEQVHAIRVSADYFRLFGAPMVQGRTFTAVEDRPGGGHVAVLSYGLWQRRFAGDPRIAGTSISLGGAPYTVVGILGPEFHTELDEPPDVWLPFQIDPNSRDHAHYFNVVARLKPGVTIGVAQAELQVAAAEFRRRFPNIMGARDSFSARPFRDAIVSDVRSSLLVLAGAVCFVLLIACANVANLLLVRATGRKREIAVRAAIGAGRSRIIRQLLTESVVLALAGGAIGFVLGMTGVRSLLAVNPGNIPRIGGNGSAVPLDWRLFVFAALASLVSGIVFGLVPAFEVSRADLSAALNEGGGRSGGSLRQNRARSLLVVSETALALVLLVGAGLLIRTFVALRSVNPGFDGHNVVTMRMSLAGSRLAQTSGVSRLVREAVQRVEALPGVVRAAASYNLPLEGAFGIPFNIVGRAAGNAHYDGRGWIGASPGYFEIFKIPVLRGRVFDERDDAGAAPVAVISQAMAREFWPGGDPVGERIILGKGYGPEFEEPARRIIGVVGDVHEFGLDNHPGPLVYVPLAQVTDGITALALRASTLAWIARTRMAPRSVSAAIESELHQASGGLPVARIRSMEDIRRRSTACSDFNMLLLTIFGCAALLLAAIGIYGIMAYSVEQRAQEIGIRLAVGAESRDVRNMVVYQGMCLALAGVTIGLGAAFGLARLLSSLLFGVAAWDPLVFTIVPVVLSAVALSAVWLPARRAARTDPVKALRQG